MRIGIDLDNTIVCYDELFHRVAVREGLAPATCPTDKQAVRDFLRAAGREDDWTRLQGLMYGHSMQEAVPFAGVAEFLRAADRQRAEVHIVSHRTRRPYLGPPTDLHQAARDWLERHGLLDTTRGGLPQERVFLEETLEGKLRRIADLKLDVFIDDLPELLLHAAFPAGVRRICFDPMGRCHEERLERVGSWAELTPRLFSHERRA